DNLGKEACGQLLPQPQEGLTSRGLTPTQPLRSLQHTLYVSASLGGKEDEGRAAKAHMEVQ
ncbi:hypothetical protein KUCAC02_031025, partial [Chaenocephalus aceratus]